MKNTTIRGYYSDLNNDLFIPDKINSTALLPRTKMTPVYRNHAANTYATNAKNSAKYFYYKANAYESIQYDQKALELYKKALKIDPGLKEAKSRIFGIHSKLYVHTLNQSFNSKGLLRAILKEVLKSFFKKNRMIHFV